MNYWTDLSLQYATQKSYLDDLYQVYPVVPNGIREIDNELWNRSQEAFLNKDNIKLIETLLKLKLFPIKDSYVAYLKRDKTALERNPATAARLAGILYEMGLDAMLKKCSEPKETNRQIGPLFRRWLKKGSLGIVPVSSEEFLASGNNAIVDGGDAQIMALARQYLGYTGTKGLDFVGRFNGKYVIGEAKFLTDFGGHQNAQFNDAVKIFDYKLKNVIPVAILDGVVYIPGAKKKNQMFKNIETKYEGENIMSALVLREFLYQV